MLIGGKPSPLSPKEFFGKPSSIFHKSSLVPYLTRCIIFYLTFYITPYQTPYLTPSTPGVERRPRDERAARLRILQSVLQGALID